MRQSSLLVLAGALVLLASCGGDPAEAVAKAQAAQINDEDLALAFIESKFFSPANTTWNLVNGRIVSYSKPKWGGQQEH